MKLVLTIQLQQDNGTPVFTGTQTKNDFAASERTNSIFTDFNLINSFLVGGSIKNLVRYMAWIANGVIATPAPATIQISSLGDAEGN